MKHFSLLSLSLLLTSATTVYAHPAPELEIIEARGYIDVPTSLLQIRGIDGDQLERREMVEIVRLEARGDGNGGETSKAGKILDKTGKGLSIASTVTTGIPIVGTAMTVVKTAVEIFAKILSAIGAAQHGDSLKRGAFTQDVVKETLQKHPGWNCVVVHTKHKKDFKGTEGKDWAHAHQELKVKFPVGSTIGFEIYTFREGDFQLLGDGGFQNWAYGGNVLKGTAKEKKLTFGASAQAKGTAADAVKGTGEKAAKDAAKQAKEQLKAEKNGGNNKKAASKASKKKK